jgi:hypothetical protein
MKYILQYAYAAPIALLLSLADISNPKRAVAGIVILALIALRDYVKEQA